MNEYQLKLAKLYAELIGVELYREEFISDSVNNICALLGNAVSKDEFCDSLKPGSHCHFNPFTGQLQLDARDNFEVEIDYDEGCMYKIWVDRQWRRVPFESKPEISTAVIECILKSKGLI
jgi:hypothetical protein